jgi:hypothetical protein
MIYSTDGALLPWIRTLEMTLNERYPPGIVEGRSTVDDLHPPTFNLVDVDAEAAIRYVENSPAGGLAATVMANRRTTAMDWEQDVRHLELEVGDDAQSVFILALEAILTSL